MLMLVLTKPLLVNNVYIVLYLLYIIIEHYRKDVVTGSPLRRWSYSRATAGIDEPPFLRKPVIQRDSVPTCVSCFNENGWELAINVLIKAPKVVKGKKYQLKRKK